MLFLKPVTFKHHIFLDYMPKVSPPVGMLGNGKEVSVVPGQGVDSDKIRNGGVISININSF